MFNHGLSAAGMFFLVGVIYERTHTRNLNEFGGLFPLVPVYGGILIFTSMASLGLPGLNGFVSEFLVVRGALADPDRLHGHFHARSALHRRLHPERDQESAARPLNEHWAHGEHKLTEINTREILVMAPLMVLILWIGIWPAWILDVINKAVVMLF
jgi:NADH-quinone oxidoreductase subunit M